MIISQNVNERLADVNARFCPIVILCAPFHVARFHCGAEICTSHACFVAPRGRVLPRGFSLNELSPMGSVRS